MAVPAGRTNFFFEKDEFQGFGFELFRELEKHLYKSRRRGEPALTVIFHLVPVSNLVDAVTQGKADIAAGIVITEERQRAVVFTQPYLYDINTVVVSNMMTPPISSVRELSSKSVLVNRGSSYPGLLRDLGQVLTREGLAPPSFELVETLETEDIFELVNSGVISWTIAHEHHAKLWKQVLPNLRIYWLGLAAVAFQESRFDPTLRSRAGAVGLMQIRPESAAEVGVVGIEDPEKNVQAAALYFDLLAERYFNEPELDNTERVAFILDAYNAGPTRIQRLRREANEHDLDPNRWFGNMETLALRKIGREPVAYVANVAKCYLCLSRMLLTAEEREAESLDLQ